MALAHQLNAKPRTQDVLLEENISFCEMMLTPKVLSGLNASGFKKPSPIQLKSIPMGRCGFDLIVEAKSGTGKTAVFGIIALEMLNTEGGLQVLIIAPTREIALQISQVLKTIGSSIDDLSVECVMGGTSEKEDINKFKCKKQPNIIVGSPGRLRSLIEKEVLDTSSVRLFVMDEVDKLLEKSFQPDINYIFSKSPERKQVIATSATYDTELRTFLARYMKSPIHLCPSNSVILLGVAHFFTTVKKHENVERQSSNRYEELKKILTEVNFRQCLVFCNYQNRAKNVCSMLKRDGWPTDYLSACQEQSERLSSLESLQEFKCRILVATDLASRGLDSANVDLIINFEPPTSIATYLHRIGRAGRYGSYGSAITLLTKGSEESQFMKLLCTLDTNVDFFNFWSKAKLDINAATELESNVCIENSSDNGNTDKIDSNNIKYVLEPIVSYFDIATSKVELASFDNLLKSFNNTKNLNETLNDKQGPNDLASPKFLLQDYVNTEKLNEHLIQYLNKGIYKNDVTEINSYIHREKNNINNNIQPSNILNKETSNILNKEASNILNKEILNRKHQQDFNFRNSIYTSNRTTHKVSEIDSDECVKFNKFNPSIAKQPTKDTLNGENDSQKLNTSEVSGNRFKSHPQNMRKSAFYCETETAPTPKQSFNGTPESRSDSSSDESSSSSENENMPCNEFRKSLHNMVTVNWDPSSYNAWKHQLELQVAQLQHYTYIQEMYFK